MDSKRKTSLFLIILFFIPQLCFAGIDFDGVDDFVNCGNDSSLEMSSDFSISCWVRADTDPPLGAIRGIVGKAGDAADGGGEDHNYWVIFQENVFVVNEGICCGFEDDAGANYHLTYDMDVVPGTTYHIVFAFDDSLDTEYLYVDGNLVLSEGEKTGTPTNNDQNMLIGRYRDDSAGVRFDGLINEVAIWNTTLSPSEVTTLYGSGAARRGTPLQIKPANLMGYWPMDDGADGTSADGDTVLDRSGQGNHGTGDDGDDDAGCLWETDSPLSDYPGVRIEGATRIGQ